MKKASLLILIVLFINNQSFAEEISEELLTTDHYISYDLQNESILFSTNF